VTELGDTERANAEEKRRALLEISGSLPSSKISLGVLYETILHSRSVCILISRKITPLSTLFVRHSLPQIRPFTSLVVQPIRSRIHSCLL
jgi:hypothetical protein